MIDKSNNSNGCVNVLSLFDGMSCGMLAMMKAGINVGEYYAYEIDKYAIQTSQHNFPQIKQCGDVFNGDYTQYQNIDYLIGGSPCTFWSIAQSTDKRETTASGVGWELFSQYVRALCEANPKYFIYENNKSMAKAIYDSISETFGFEPICINSALVSAQNRQRLYWVGKRNDDGTYSKVDIKQPEDRGVLLRDVIVGVTDREKGRAVIGSTGRTTEREYFKKNQGNMSFEPVGTTKDGKSQVLKSQYYKNNASNFFNDNTKGCKYAATGVAEPVACRCRGRKDKNGNGYAKYECREDGKYNTVDTNSGAAMIVEPVHNSIQVGALPRPNGELSTSQGFRIYDINAKSVTLKGCSGGAGGKTGLYAIPVEFENDIPTKAVSYADGKTYKVHEVQNGLITIKGKEYPIKLQDGYYIIRKLTVSECKRLQTVPEWYEFPVSDTQAYKMLGNGWTVDVIAHLIKATR